MRQKYGTWKFQCLLPLNPLDSISVAKAKLDSWGCPSWGTGTWLCPLHLFICSRISTRTLSLQWQTCAKLTATEYLAVKRHNQGSQQMLLIWSLRQVGAYWQIPWLQLGARRFFPISIQPSALSLPTRLFWKSTGNPWSVLGWSQQCWALWEDARGALSSDTVGCCLSWMEDWRTNLVANLEHPHLVLPTPLLQGPGCGGGLGELVGSLHGSSCCRGSACRNLGEHRWALTHNRYHRRTKSCQRSITLLCSTVVCPYALLTNRRPIMFT